MFSHEKVTKSPAEVIVTRSYITDPPILTLCSHLTTDYRHAKNITNIIYYA